MSISRESAAALAAAVRYVVRKDADGGVTVGLTLGNGRYGQGESPSGDVDAAVRQAFERAAGGGRGSD